MSNKKKAAAAAYLRREADLAAAAVAHAEVKLEKFQDLVADCEAQLEEAILRAQEAQKAADAAAAAADGLPVSVNAEPADIGMVD